MIIEFKAIGIPKGQPRPRAFARNFGGKWQARVYDAGTAESWKSCIASAAKSFLPATPLEGPLAVNITLWFPRPKSHCRSNGELKPNAPIYHTSKPDRDNAEKAVLDTLTQLGMWRDDSQVCAGEVKKLYANQGPSGADITIVQIYKA